jgi:nucleoside-diphosphate-sugar epimerase
MAEPKRATLLTGSSGYVGRLLAAALLDDTDGKLVLPFRGDKHDAASIVAGVLDEVAKPGARAKLEDRLLPVPWPAPESFGEMLPFLRRHGVDEVVHCAGSLSYFNQAKLRAGNLDLTRDLLGVGEQLGVRRFYYFSTAFSSGLVDGLVREELHPTPTSDPTEYTRSKRETEWLVGRSGVPYVVLRPSIVIGDSRDGRYVGKPFGLYQLWSAAERFGAERYMPVVHAIAPRVPLQVLHQDALQAAFLSVRRHAADGSVVHLVSREEALPTVRDLWDMWLDAWARPREIYHYDRLADVPLDELDPFQRMLVEFAAANIEISTHAWHFEARVLADLRERGLQFRDATPATVALCQRYFMQQSTRIQAFLEKYRDKRSHQPRIIEASAART